MSLEGKDIVNAAKKRPLIFVCAAVIFVLLIMIYWRLGAIETLRAQVDERTSVLQKNKANAAYAVQLDAQLKELTEINKKIKGSALIADNAAQNQQIFFRMEADSGAKLIDIQQRPVDTSLPKGAAALTYNPVVFAMTVEGEYRQILTFVRLLEAGPVINRVSAGTLAMGGNGLPNLSLTVEMLGLRQ